ncbi:MAG: alpha-amylase family glycosyl hydrolase [Bacteroidota bacterium]
MNKVLTSKSLVLVSILVACNTPKTEDAPVAAETKPEKTFVWNNANVYFLLTDRFNNGDPANDQMFDRKADGAVLRSFEGGDIKGVTQKINDGYFESMGITAIWLTPIWEQVHGFTDEGTGKTYAYHGYWARDWTAVDPNYGTFEELKEMVNSAHAKGIRILMDVVINHTGPVTGIDSQWPDSWVRTEPTCTYQDAPTTISCTLVENLPDIYTGSNEPVELPEFLVNKWKEEGRYEQEVAELNAFFSTTGHPRAPRFYIMKWIIDYVKELGVDGFRVDTAKHTEAEIWGELKKLAVAAFEDWKNKNPDKKLDNTPFYMTGEVYNYSLYSGKQFDMGGGEMVNFYDNGFESLINFAFKGDANKPSEELFSFYSDVLNKGDLKGYSILNYISSHDDGGPFDKERQRVFEAGTKLLLTPGASQIYYGDETARPLVVEGANGDANLRTFMNWNELSENAERNGYTISDVQQHWAKLGRFRKEHVAVGAGIHEKISDAPYTFQRTYSGQGHEDKVVVAMDYDGTELTVSVEDVFQDGTQLKEYYTGQNLTVENGTVSISNAGAVVLLGKS